MKHAAMFVLSGGTECNAARQIVRFGDRSASAQCASFTQEKNAQYERYSRRASDPSREVEKFARHRRDSLSREPVSECSDKCGMHFLCFAVPGAILRRTSFNRDGTLGGDGPKSQSVHCNAAPLGVGRAIASGHNYCLRKQRLSAFATVLPASIKCQARTRRKSVGVTPVSLRNAELKELVSLKPTSSPICVTARSGWPSSCLARSIRRAVR